MILRLDYCPMTTGYGNIRGFYVYQPEDNRASRSLSCTQAVYRRISSQVGDHWRIPAVVCFLFLFLHNDGCRDRHVFAE
jgi:hypothetical protein